MTEISIQEASETPVDTFSQKAEIFRDRMAEMFGIDGETPAERIKQLKALSVEGVAIMLEDINKLTNDTDESMVSHDRAIKVGDNDTVAPEYRHQVFTELIYAIKNADKTVTPERIADTLALGTVLLHPFKDGNGRTARTIGLLFRENYDADDYDNDFMLASGSRDKVRATFGWNVNGYIPYIKGDQSDPEVVTNYLHSLLTEDKFKQYESCFGQAPLHIHTLNN